MPSLRNRTTRTRYPSTCTAAASSARALGPSTFAARANAWPFSARDAAFKRRCLACSARRFFALLALASRARSFCSFSRRRASSRASRFMVSAADALAPPAALLGLPRPTAPAPAL